MNATAPHAFPAIHNAMWPGLVGKGPDSEPPIDLDTMLDLTAAARVDGVGFDGVDLFLSLPHTDIDSTDDDLARLAENTRIQRTPRRFAGGAGLAADRRRVRDGRCHRARALFDAGRKGLPHRQQAARVEDPSAPGSSASIAPPAPPNGPRTRPAAPGASRDTFREAANIAESFGERLAAEGEICWAGMHSWRNNVQLLEMVDRPKTVGFQADMAHTMLFTMGYNAPEDRLLPDDFDWSQSDRLAEAYAKMAAALRPWTIDFHVAQNDGTVKGSGSHDKTGRHCPPNDPNGKLDIVRDSGAWLRGDDGEPTRAMQHICWDGCMFPNSVMLDPKTWEDVLRAMIAVRNAHGWN